MLRMDVNPELMRQQIHKFPFQYKLWLIVHLDFCDFLRWNRDGTVILVRLFALQNYLNSAHSIFNIKNSSMFFEQLEEFEFVRLNSTTEADDMLLQYKHAHFQRDGLGLLRKIRRHTGQLWSEIERKESATASAEIQKSRLDAQMLEDLCFKSHGGLSNIQKSRLYLLTILSFQCKTRLLREQQRESTTLNGQCYPKSNVFKCSIKKEVVEALSENPLNSVLHLENELHAEYAGYYGNCSKQQLQRFFGDYLCLYENDAMEIEQMVTKVDDYNMYKFDMDAEQSYELAQPHKECDKSISSPGLAISPQSIGNLSNLSLEPIFNTDEEEMKDNRDVEIKLEPGIFPTDFPCMPLPVKTEFMYESDTENKIDFANFFCEYRAALNLLYDYSNNQ